LVTYSYVHFKINLFSTLQSDIQHYFNNIIIPNKHQIISLCLWNSKVIEKFLLFLVIDSTFNHLESLVLHRIKLDKLMFLLINLTSLPHFLSLKIHLDDHSKSLGNVYQLIFRLPFLKYNKFTLIHDTSHEILMPLLNDNKEQISIIKYLIINHSCTLNDITNILYYTSQLCLLRCKRLLKSDRMVNEELYIMLPNLIHISIESCNVLFEHFEIFIKKISSHLKLLRINTSEDITYLKADRWEQLITQHMPRLHKFYFEYRQFIDDRFEFTPTHMQFNRFISSFWIERQWLFELKIYVSVISSILLFSIHPHRYINNNLLYL